MLQRYLDMFPRARDRSRITEVIERYRDFLDPSRSRSCR